MTSKGQQAGGWNQQPVKYQSIIDQPLTLGAQEALCVCVCACVCVCVLAPEAPPLWLPQQPARGQRTENKQKKGGDAGHSPRSRSQTGACPTRPLVWGKVCSGSVCMNWLVGRSPPKVGTRPLWGHRRVIWKFLVRKPILNLQPNLWEASLLTPAPRLAKEQSLEGHTRHVRPWAC